MQPEELNDLITQAEAARIRGVSREAIYRLVLRGKLTVTEIGGQKFVRRSEVENYKPEVGGRPSAKTTVQTVKSSEKKSGSKKSSNKKSGRNE